MLLTALFYVLILLNVVSGSKLNVPSVLLPYNHDTPSNFTLKIQDGGCYEWSSSRREVILIGGNPGECSSEVVVSAVTRSSSRITAVVLAKEMDTKMTLRCDVIVDSISRLQIVTTTRELYAEEAPEEFEVRAYDAYGNEFSTVEGQIFVWELHTITDQATVVPAEMVLRFITFDASPYKTPPAIAPLEFEGKQGYMVLIEGVRTGLARLSVKMAHSAYKNLDRDEVDLMVLANVILEPQEAFILPRTSVKYSAFQLKHGIFHPIDIVDSHYYLQVSEKTIGYLEDDGMNVSGQMLGSTTVILQDINMKAFETLKRPTATLNVVDPSYLSITIAPHNNPALIVGNEYTFHVHIYDKNNNKILPSDNIVVESVVDQEYIRTDFISKNGTHIEGVPLMRGQTKISAKLTAIDLEDELVAISPPLRATLSLDIYDRIRVVPPVTLLPWDPITKPMYKVNLTAERAFGSVIWHTDNPGLVEVTSMGLCQTKGEGSAVVSASLSVNPHNKDDAKIFVEEVLDLNFVRDVVEVEVETPLSLKAAMSTVHEGEERVFFTQCERLPLKLNVQDSYFSASEFQSSTLDNSCVSVDLMSRVPAFTDVSLSYNATSATLSDSIVIGAYRPLHPLSPSSGETVLALGTSRVLLFEGGPLPWVKKTSGHFVKVENEKQDELKSELVIRKPSSESPIDVYAVYVECLSIGEYEIRFHVGNAKSETLPNPVHVSSSVTVACAVPDSLSLNSGLPFPQDCPSIDRRTVLSFMGESVPLLVQIKDSQGRLFDNVSSLSIDWALSDSSLGQFGSEGLSDTISGSTLHGYRVQHREGRIVNLNEVTGKFEVSASVLGYKNPAFSHVFVPTLSDSLVVSAVERVRIDPSELVLYNHDQNKAELQIKGGSGFFELKDSDWESVITVDYVEETATLLVSPLNDGNVSVVVRDLCLERPTLPTASIRVSSVGSLEVSIPERVEEGGTIEAVVTATDMEGRPVPVHTSMQLTPHPKSAIIKLSFVKVNEEGKAVFLVEGVTVGDTSIHFSCKRGTLNLQSVSKPVQVFPPLMLLPERITVIVGSKFQIETRGGPYPDSSIEFVLSNETVCDVSHSGVSSALALGSASLSAKAVVPYRDGGKLEVLSKNAVIIDVVALSAIRISAPLRHIEAGQNMPVYAIGSGPRETPVSYATSDPPLLFEWALTSKHVGSFSSVYYENDVFEAAENFGIGRFSGLKPGTVTLTLRVTPTDPQTPERFQIDNNLVLQDSLEIEVFEPLKLLNPDSADAKILLSPNSQTKIETNRDVDGVVTYVVNGCGPGRSSVPLVQVSTEGVVKASAELGVTSITVTVKEKFGITQTMSILVEVRPVVYLEAQSSRFMGIADKSSYFSALPVGVSHDLKFAFHDNRGRVFTSTDAHLDFRSSRFDLISVVQSPSSNDTFKVNVQSPGVTVLHVWDRRNPLINDYIKIESRSAVIPDKISVPVGSLICLSSELRGANGEKGAWRSHSSLLTLDAVSGVGAAYQQGKVAISYEVSKEVVATSEIHISPIRVIQLNVPSLMISNVIRESGFFVSVNFEGDSPQSSSSHCFPSTPPSPLVPFECRLAFAPHLSSGLVAEDIFLVSAVYVPGEGFGCQLRTLLSSDEGFATSSPRLLLEAIAVGVGGAEGARTNLTEVPFKPAVYVETSEMKLSTASPSGTIRLMGPLDSIQSFRVVDEDKKVEAEVVPESDTVGHLVVSATDEAWTTDSSPEPLNVLLASSLTGQEIQVHVVFEEAEPGSCPVGTTRRSSGPLATLLSFVSKNQGSLFILVCITISLICVFISYHVLLNPGYRQTGNADVFAKSPGPGSRFFGVSSLATPVATSPPQDALKRVGAGSPGRQPPLSLWSVDQEPVYGDPIFRSSPRPAYEGSPTYSSHSPKS